MPVLYSLESLFRSCSKLHGGEHFEIGIFLADASTRKLAEHSVIYDHQDEDNELERCWNIATGNQDVIHITKAQQLARHQKRAPDNTDYGNLYRECGEWVPYLRFWDYLDYLDERHKGDSPALFDEYFKPYDPQGTGFCDPNELKHLMQNLGDKNIKPDWMDEMIKEYGKGDGRAPYSDIGKVVYGDPLSNDIMLHNIRNGMGEPMPDNYGDGTVIKMRHADDAGPGASEPEVLTKQDIVDKLKENDDFLDKIYQMNEFKSQSQNRRKTSKFGPPFNKANYAPTQQDLQDFKKKYGEFIDKPTMVEVLRELNAKYKDEDLGSLQYYEYYDPQRTGKVSRSVILWQLQAYGEALAKDEAEEVVLELMGTDDPVDYRVFYKRLLESPRAAVLLPHPEVSPELATTRVER